MMNKENITAMPTQQGQIVIVLLLVMVVALALGLSIVGHSISDISNSTNVEDSARAYSAAEASIEKALVDTNNSGTLPLTLANNSKADVNWTRLIPPINTALEYPAFGKESFAHFWLANPKTAIGSANIVDQYYNQNSFQLYFGSTRRYSLPDTDPVNKPAVEVHVIVGSGGGSGATFTSRKFYFDSFNGTGIGRSGFSGCDVSPDERSDQSLNPNSILTNNNTTRHAFYCRVTVSGIKSGSEYPVLARVRILYTNLSHPVALQPTGSCSGNPTACSLPPQVSIYTAKGISGSVARDLEVFQQQYVVPYMFDYVLFSAGQLNKDI